MSVFSARPDLTPTASVALMEAESTMPSPLQRYHQASKKADIIQWLAILHLYALFYLLRKKTMYYETLLCIPLQILFPALRLCQALLSSLGGRSNLSASAQVKNIP